MRLFVFSVVILLSVCSFSQSEENDAPDLVMQSWATTYNLSSRLIKFQAEQKRMLENFTPVRMAAWENLGPNTMDTLSGRMICLTIDPNNPERLTR